MLNTFPYNNGHVMVSPNRHIGDPQKLTDKEVSDIFKTLRQVFSLLDKILKPQGYNVGMNIGKCGGAGIPGHLHMHVVPRWTGDTNFMPVIGKTDIVSIPLEWAYRTIKAEFDKL